MCRERGSKYHDAALKLLSKGCFQKRDPENKITGRRDIPWKEIVTPSLAKLLNIPAKINKK